VKGIQAHSAGARIGVEGQDESNGPYRSIHIVGNPHQVEHAIALIQAQFESQQDGDDRVGQISSCRRALNPSAIAEVPSDTNINVPRIASAHD
jgi:KH domain